MSFLCRIEHAKLGYNQSSHTERENPKSFEQRSIIDWTIQFRLRDIRNYFSSTKYKHTFKCTEVGETIKSTYDKLRNIVTDWSSENLRSLKQKLHKNNEYRKDKSRKYDNTWGMIQESTKNRKQRDINFLLAHDALLLADTLIKRSLRIPNECRLCNSAAETRQHLFHRCRIVQTTLKYLQSLIGKTLSEEELLYHEGNQKMRKKVHFCISDFKQTIWIIRALLYYGEIKQNELEISMLNMFKLKSRLHRKFPLLIS